MWLEGKRPCKRARRYGVRNMNFWAIPHSVGGTPKPRPDVARGEFD
jgi:hypothetical protein